MAEDDEEKVFVNVQMGGKLRQMLDRMVLADKQEDDEFNRSAFIRRLIRREWERRSVSAETPLVVIEQGA